MPYNLEKHNIVFTELPKKWIDGLFTGNGEIGAMIWGTGEPFKITLDKIDFWEERMPQDAKWGKDHNWNDMKELIKRGDRATLIRKYQHYLDQSGKNKKWQLQPTRLPVPRLEIDTKEQYDEINMEIKLRSAMIEGTVVSKASNLNIKSYIHSARNFFVFHIESTNEEPLKFFDDDVKIDYEHLDEKAKQTLKEWGYPPLKYDKVKSEYNYFTHTINTCYQQIPEGQGGLLISWIVRTNKLETEMKIIVHMASKNNLDNVPEETDDDALYQLILQFSKDQWENFGFLQESEFLADHLEFWNNFWKKSAISIPDNIIENLYYIELYKLACNTRSGKFPCPLQGIWTLDGTMPPWCGDYHLDMNVQETYWPTFSSNHVELSEPLFRYMSKNLPKFEECCRNFYGCDGALTTCSISLHGENLHGYYNTEVWPGNGVWLAHMYWLRWRYTMDKEFLESHAYPMMKKTWEVYDNLLKKNDFDEYGIPLSSSPEFFENRIEAWGANPTCDIALIKWLTSALIESVKILEKDSDPYFKSQITRWREVNDDLVYYPADYSGLMIYENQRYDYPHRHMTHLFPIHPFHLVTVEGDQDDRYLINSSLKNLRKQGDWEYTGWTLPWLSIFGSWSNNQWMAYKWLRNYLNFIKPNSMHINGDPNDYGICTHVYEPMTLEAGFCFVEAVNQLLLKSWGGIIRICESLPNSWRDAAFHNLRAEGAFLVSSSIHNRNLEFILIKSEVGGLCRVKNRFLGDKSYDLLVYVFDTETEVEIHEQKDDVIGFKTEKDCEYVVFPAGRSLEEIQGIVTQVRDQGIKPVKPLFCGEGWFGLQKRSKNPYLP